jgi:DNA-binding NtrC family response regulator
MAMAAAIAQQWPVWNVGRMLVVSSRADVRERVLKVLSASAPETSSVATEAAGGADALMKLEGSDYGTLVLDPQIDDLDVTELVTTIRGRYPRLHLVMMKGGEDSMQMSLELAQPATASGAATSRAEAADAPLVGTGDESELIDRPLSPRRAPHAWAEPLPGMIGTSRRMQKLYRLARLVAPRDTVVLIVGGTGTGKELVARGIHQVSRRSRGPFVVVNCAAIPETLLEAELFGYTRGAFTGAVQARLGRIHAAHGGTLLLDEIGELPLSMQAKLLRFVQEGEVQRLGSADLFRVDTRLIAATNVDLLQRVRDKQFREDLYYRLAVFPVELPALRQRQEDILPLAQSFLTSLARQAGCREKYFTPAAMNLMRRHSWPGNVRELQHWVERAFVLAESSDEIDVEEFDLSDETN